MKYNRVGTLVIDRCKSKSDTIYYMAYYDGDFRFVHIHTKAVPKLIVSKSKSGKKYFIYHGDFIYTEDKAILIYG